MTVTEDVLGVADREVCHRVAGELPVEAQIATWILRLKKSVLPAPQVSSHLEDVPPARVGKRIQQLVIVLAKVFGEEVLVAHGAEPVNDEVGQSPRRRIIGIIDSRNSQLLSDRLTGEKRNCPDHVAHVADLQFVDLVVGKGVNITESGGQGLVVDISGKHTSASQTRKWVRAACVHVAVA